MQRPMYTVLAFILGALNIHAMEKCGEARDNSAFIGFPTPDEHLTHALYTAALKGDIPEIERVLAAGVNPDTPLTSNGLTALMKATMQGHLPAVKKFLLAGANPNIQDKDSRVALHYASKYLDIFETLLAGELIHD